jgi:hypothetical protein
MKFEGARARNFVEQFIFFVPILVFFGSQEAVKKIWSKNRIFTELEFPSFRDFYCENKLTICGQKIASLVVGN